MEGVRHLSQGSACLTPGGSGAFPQRGRTYGSLRRFEITFGYIYPQKYYICVKSMYKCISGYAILGNVRLRKKRSTHTLSLQFSGDKFEGGCHMHGLIFVTWEKYLSDRFGSNFLHTYRNTIGETPANSPLASRVYDDATLLAGVSVASRLSHFPADTLLREYGRYFLINGLTSHLCAYLLTQVNSGRDLLLTMREAHAQMRRVPDGLTPPVFGFEALSSYPNGLTLIYNSNRQLCPVLFGAIEGAAERYKEKVQIIERTCMKQGAAECRFEVYFFAQSSKPLLVETPEQLARRNSRQQLADFVLSVLPDEDGVTLLALQTGLRQWQIDPNQLRPSVLLEALQHLQHAGLAASTANRPGDDFAHRRYWRVPTTGK